jgi:hypothetical protein
VLLDLALLVHLEGAIGEAEHPSAARGADRAQDLLPVLRAVRIDRELADPLALRPGAGNQVNRLERAAGLSDLGRELPERLLARVELDADRDAVLSGGCHGARRIRGTPRPPACGGRRLPGPAATRTGNEGARDRSWRLSCRMGNQPANSEPALAQIAARQHGVVSAAQLRAAGI